MLKLNILSSRERREAVCPTCTYAIAQKGFNGEELTCCTLGGGLRELRFAVSECTAYTDRRLPKRRCVAGFVRRSDGDHKVTVIRIN
jgi:hypothetical protein